MDPSAGFTAGPPAKGTLGPNGFRPIPRNMEFSSSHQRLTQKKAANSPFLGFSKSPEAGGRMALAISRMI